MLKPSVPFCSIGRNLVSQSDQVDHRLFIPMAMGRLRGCILVVGA